MAKPIITMIKKIQINRYDYELLWNITININEAVFNKIVAAFPENEVTQPSFGVVRMSNSTQYIILKLLPDSDLLMKVHHKKDISNKPYDQNQIKHYRITIPKLSASI